MKMIRNLSALVLKFNTPFTKNIATLLSGNAIAYAVPLILYPLLSRVYSPDDYALFGIYASLFSFLEIASAGRYDFAIVIPEKDSDAANLVVGGTIISIAYLLITTLLISVLGSYLADMLNNPLLKNWLIFLPPAIFLISCTKVANAWLIRKSRFRAAAINKVSQKISEVVAQAACGFFKSGNGLIIGDFVGRFLNSLFSLYQALRSGFDWKLISIVKIRANLKRYIDLPKYGILPSMLNSLAGMLPVFFVSSYYSTEVSGSYNFTRVILSVPFALIATGISQVLMQQVSEKKNRGESIARDLRSLYFKLSCLSMIAFLILSTTGTELFGLIFGDRWRLAGDYMSILILSTAVSFTVSPFTILLIVLEKVKWLSYWQVFYFCLISMMWFFKKISIHSFLITLVCFDLFAYILYAFIIYKVVSQYERRITKLRS